MSAASPLQAMAAGRGCWHTGFGRACDTEGCPCPGLDARGVGAALLSTPECCSTRVLGMEEYLGCAAYPRAQPEF